MPARRNDPFYLVMSLLMFALVTYGFSQTVGPSLTPPTAHIHPVYRYGLPFFLAAQLAVIIPVWPYLG
jgi:hypothetical protein